MIPGHVHFFLCGYRYRRIYYNIIEQTRKYMLRIMKLHPQNIVFNELIKYAKNKGISVSAVLSVTLFTILYDCKQVAETGLLALEKLRQDPDENLSLWIKDSINYLREAERLTISPNRYSEITKQDNEYDIGGKLRTIHAGISLKRMEVIGVNLNPEYYADPTTFDANRISRIDL